MNLQSDYQDRQRKRSAGRIHERVSFGPYSVEIRVNGDGIFSFEHGVESLKSANLVDVRKAANAALKKHSALEWKPILSVCFGDHDSSVNNLDHSADITIYIERSYIAWTGRKWIECPWAVQPPGHYICSPHNPSNEDQCQMDAETLAWRRLAESSDWWSVVKDEPSPVFPICEGESLGRITYHVPYNEATWQTMLGLIAKFQELRQQIHGLLKTSSGWTVLAEMSKVMLLQPPKETGQLKTK